METTVPPRNPADYRQAIADLLEQAEARFAADMEAREAQAGDSPAVLAHIQGLDLEISEAALIALRAEFLRYAGAFDTHKSREAIHQAVSDVTKPLIEAWVNAHMADITREVVREALGRISEVRPANITATNIAKPPES